MVSSEGSDFHLLSLSTCPGQWMIGTQQVAWLHFQAVSNQTSAFVALNLDDIVGYRLDGTEARNFAPQSGRLVIIGEEPLLEAYFNASGQPDVMLYSRPGTTNIVLSSDDLSAPVISWTPSQTVPMTNLFQLIQPPLNSPRLFFRARREP